MVLGIDLGTASVLVYVEGRGIVLSEPSVVAIDRSADRIVAVGEEARQMIGKTPMNISAIRPVREGVIADYEITEAMLRYFINRAKGRGFHLFRPSVIVCVPAEVTSVEKRAVIEAALSAGAKKAALISEPMAAALGAGIDIDQPVASMVVDIGGGTTDVAVLSLGGIIAAESVKVAGNKIDESIIKYIRGLHNLMIGERAAEDLKFLVGSAIAGRDERFTDLQGRDIITGLPKTVRISSSDLAEAVSESLAAILGAIKKVLERTPPELAGDLVDNGLLITGGGALLPGLDLFFQKELNIPVKIAEDPLACVAIGTGMALYRDIVFTA